MPGLWQEQQTEERRGGVQLQTVLDFQIFPFKNAGAPSPPPPNENAIHKGATTHKGGLFLVVVYLLEYNYSHIELLPSNQPTNNQQSAAVSHALVQ